MGWGVSQARNEPHAAYVPSMIDLIEQVTRHPVQMWGKEDRETLCDLYHKGLWDFEVVYMDRYFSREVLLSSLTKEQLIDKVRSLDQNHGPSGRSHSGKFHPWRQWLISCRAHYDKWGASHDKGHARGRHYPRNHRTDKSSSAPVKQAWSANPISEEPLVKQITQKVDRMKVNRVVYGFCNNCLKVVDKDHQGCTLRYLKCHQEGHRLAECTANGTSDPKTPNKAGKSKNHGNKPRGDKKVGNTGRARPQVQQLAGPADPTASGGAAEPPATAHQPQQWRNSPGVQHTFINYSQG